MAAVLYPCRACHDRALRWNLTAKRTLCKFHLDRCGVSPVPLHAPRSNPAGNDSSISINRFSRSYFLHISCAYCTNCVSGARQSRTNHTVLTYMLDGWWLTTERRLWLYVIRIHSVPLVCRAQITSYHDIAVACTAFPNVGWNFILLQRRTNRSTCSVHGYHTYNAIDRGLLWHSMLQ